MRAQVDQRPALPDFALRLFLDALARAQPGVCPFLPAGPERALARPAALLAAADAAMAGIRARAVERERVSECAEGGKGRRGGGGV